MTHSAGIRPGAMRLLVVFQARDSALDHPGYFAAFRQLVREGRLAAFDELPFLDVLRRGGWSGLWDEIVERAAASRADAVFFHFFHAPGAFDARRSLDRLRELPRRPTLFASLGDPFGIWTNRVPLCFRQVAAAAEVNFLTGMGYLARRLTDWGARNLVLMPHGICQERFRPDDVPAAAASPDFDVVFIGNRPRPRNPFSHYAATIRARVRFVETFSRRYGKRFAVFGRGWGECACAQGPIPYAGQHAACRRGKVVVGGMPNGYHEYYTSDRPYIALGSGVPFVDFRVRGVDRIFQDGREWWLGESIDAMADRCDEVLAMSDGERAERGAQVKERIFAGHTQYHRCAEMLSIVESVREARRAGTRASEPTLSFLRPGSPDAIVNWVG